MLIRVELAQTTAKRADVILEEHVGSAWDEKARHQIGPDRASVVLELQPGQRLRVDDLTE